MNPASSSRTAARPALGKATAALRQAMAGLQPRERRAVTLALWVVGLGLLWWIALAPAWSTLSQASERHAGVDAQLAEMRNMAASAQALRALGNPPPPDRETALRALDQATAALGANGQIEVLGERATLTLNNASPEALAQWLQQMRLNARLVPVEARLTRAEGAVPVWSGMLVVSGPGLRGGSAP
jgi:general secretion pathway protein M